MFQLHLAFAIGGNKDDFSQVFFKAVFSFMKMSFKLDELSEL